MKHFLFAFILCLMAQANINGQVVYGTIENDLGEKLYGATIQWEFTAIGTVADQDGSFVLPKMDTTKNLHIHYIGYSDVLIPVEPHEDTISITISGITDLMEVEVAARIKDNYISTLSTLNIEQISSGELRKAACCNLAESFATNAGIDVNYTDAITGAREIQMLGLRGIYTQMMIEKRPALTGLGTAFSMEYIPGTWLHSIQISKGASSVQNGYHAIAGQINSELVKPFEDQPLYLNLYGSTFGRGELNVHLNKSFNTKWSAGAMLHGSSMHNELDENQDGFYDTQQKDMLDGMLRIFYRGDNIRSQFNIHALTDEHEGGQIDGIGPLYQIFQKNERLEAFWKMGYIGFANPNHSLGIIANMSYHSMDASYGFKKHNGDQHSAYANLIFETTIELEHKLSAGASFQYDRYEEFLDEYDNSRTEKITGAFVEYNLNPTPIDNSSRFFKNIGLIAGLRVDHHNQFDVLVTPRFNIKYNFSERSIIRFSAGRGYKSPNVISENIGLLASSKDFVITEELEIEDAWNYGINFTQSFKFLNRDASFAVDLYRTDFDNQIILDREQQPNKILVYNLDGESYANSLLTVFSFEPLRRLNIKASYKLADVKISYVDGLREKPLISRNRGLIALDYETSDEKWMFNSTVQLVGKKRFPKNDQVPSELIVHHTGYSPSLIMVGCQVTRIFGKLEIYFGSENLTGVTQENAIIDWENPFGEYFDATQVYAPITGRMFYLGLRYGLDRKEE